MTNIKWSYFIVCFHFICWSAVISIISYWIYIYTLNEDLCLVDYKNYFESKSDEPPALSICLKNPIAEEKMKMVAPQVEADTYLRFLNGDYFNVTLLDIEYQQVIYDFSEHTPEIYLSWTNGTNGYARSDLGEFKTANAFMFYNRFYQCYELQSPKVPGLNGFGVRINSTVFPDRTKPQNYEMYTLLHYPNHFLTSNGNMRHSLTRESNDKYVMRYSIDGVEVIRRRNKRSRPCYDWSNLDARIIESHINKVGCRASYQPRFNGISLCSTELEMKNASWNFSKKDYGIYRPCKSMEKIYYTHTEADLSTTIYAKDNMVDIYIYPYDQKFKEILQTRYITKI